MAILDFFQKDVNKNYKILSKNGFSTFNGIRKQQKECIKIIFENHDPIIVSKDHVFIILDYELVARNFTNR